MSVNRNSKLPNSLFKVVARRQKRWAAKEASSPEHQLSMRFYWKNLERMGKRAGIAISLLSACGILFAAGSKVQHVLDKLAALHQQVEKHEERLQQNEANDSERAAEIGYLKGRIERHAGEEQSRPPAGIAAEAREESDEPAPEISPFRSRRRPPSSPPSAISNAIPIGDKLYTTILYYYNQARRLQPNLAGQLIVICRVDPAGDLAASEVIAASPELAELAECLASKIRRWKFPEQVTGLEAGGVFRQVYFLSPQGF